MGMIEDLKKSVNTDFEKRDLIKESKIEQLEVPANFVPVKSQIEGLLRFRNDNQVLYPNMRELMELMAKLNNSLAKDKNASVEQREGLKDAFFVVYDNVINDGLLGNHLSSKRSSLYKMFDTVKQGLNDPKVMEAELIEYLGVLSSVNGHQRIQYKETGILAEPNPIERDIIRSGDYIEMPENLREESLKLQDDIFHPERLVDIGLDRE